MGADGNARFQVRRHPLAWFTLLSFVFSWAYWVPVAMDGGRLSHFPGLVGPMLAGFAVTAATDGREGIRRLARRMVRWQVPPTAFLGAAVPALVGGVTLVTVALIDGRWPSAVELGTMPGLPSVGLVGLFVLVFVLNGYGEEVGWRGFAWERIRQGRSLGRAAVVLWFWWALWHLPTFWLETGLGDFDLYLLPAWFLGLLAGAVVLGWLYDHSESSVLVVALFHTCLSMSSATLATSGPPAVATTTVVMVWAVAVLWRARAVSRSGLLRT